jgi:hypothetical protein
VIFIEKARRAAMLLPKCSSAFKSISYEKKKENSTKTKIEMTMIRTMQERMKKNRPVLSSPSGKGGRGGKHSAFAFR